MSHVKEQMLGGAYDAAAEDEPPPACVAKRPSRDDGFRIGEGAGPSAGSARFGKPRNAVHGLGGCRIEPAEVEAAISFIPEVETAIVMDKKSDSGEMSLIAFLLPKGDPAGVSMENLRKSLARFLPEYMIPSKSVLVGKLFHTHNGKFDRNALLALEAA